MAGKKYNYNTIDFGPLLNLNQGPSENNTANSNSAAKSTTPLKNYLTHGHKIGDLGCSGNICIRLKPTIDKIIPLGQGLLGDFLFTSAS